MTERPTNQWLSIGAYARVYGVSRPTVKKWRDAGLLELYTFDRLTRIRNVPPNEHFAVQRSSSGNSRQSLAMPVSTL